MHMKTALIAADDPHTAAWASAALEDLDIRIIRVPAAELVARLSAGEVDVVVLDGGRNPEPLMQTIEHAAAEGLEVRLLLLLEQEALPGLRLPVRLPCDFMVRGGSSQELRARVRAILWPGEEATTQELVRIDHLTLNLATYQASVGNVPVDFTYLEYALFSFLVTHPDRAYSREVLLRRVWGSDYYGGSRTVDVHVRRVRSKIGPELAARLETVRNVGYLWRG